MKLSPQTRQTFEKQIPELLRNFAVERELIPEAEALDSRRFLSRSIAPHVEKLSQLFNRQATDQALEHLPYWSSSSNPKNLRLSYLLAYLPCHALRVAAVWDELSYLKYSLPPGPLRCLELGSGPATASFATALSLQNHFESPEVKWTLLDQDQHSLEWGQGLLQQLQQRAEICRQKLSVEKGFQFPFQKDTRFELIISSYFLNELGAAPAAVARSLSQLMDRSLAPEGLMILVEPALKSQSRFLLQVRESLLPFFESRPEFKVLLPCLGHQKCGALENPEDWCHEEVTWDRPPYLKKLDQLVGLDRSSLPFSYLVLARSSKDRLRLLPALNPDSVSRHRLVSPAYRHGKDQEFFLCGQDGKCRARFRCPSKLQRGDILENAQIKGDRQAGRVESASVVES